MPNKRIQLLRELSADSLQPLPPEAASLGLGGGVAGVAPAPDSQWEASNERMQREDKATVGDYMGSIWRQDGLVDGAVASLVGSQLMPDPTYSPHTPEVWKELTDGIDPTYHDAFFDAHSAPHASLIRERLLQKQEDLTRLGDMGLAGNVGRIAMNVLMPDQILAAMAGGGVTAGVRAAQIARAGRLAKTPVAKAAEKATVVANQAQQAASGGAVAAGIVAGGVGNAAFEKIRQNVNFEDSSADVAIAGLLGAAITTPFALAGRHAERRIAAAASREKAAFDALRDIEEGVPLTAEKAKLAEEVLNTHQIIREVQLGRKTMEEARAELDAAHFGPRMQDEAWLDRMQVDLSERGNTMLDQMFPDRVTRRTQAQFTPEGQPLQLGYDPGITAPWTADSTLRVSPEGRVGAGALDMAAVRAEIENSFKKLSKEERKGRTLNQFMDDQLAKLGGGEAPTEVKMTMKELIAEAKKAEMAQRKVDREASLAAERAAKEAKKAAKDKAKVQEVLGGKPVEDAPAAPAQEAPMEAPTSPVVASPDVPEATPAVTPVVAPEVPAAPKTTAELYPVGKWVEFTKRGSDDEFDGIIESVDGDFVKIKDENGKVHPVHVSRIFGNEPPPPGFHSVGSMAATRVVEDAEVALQQTAMSKARLDIFATLNRSESAEVRRLVFDLVKDPIQVDDKIPQGFTASEYKSQLRRVVAGEFHRAAREASREAAAVMKVPMWQQVNGQWGHEFFTLVTRLTRGDLTIQQTHKEILPMLRKVSDAQRKAYDTLLQEAQKLGVKGAENVEPNANYVNRIWDAKGITHAMDVHGADAVIDLFAKAINVPGYIGDRAKAKQFLATVRKLEFSPVMQNIHLYAQDMGTLRKTLAAEGKLSDSEIDNIVDMMFEAKEVSGSDAGQAKNLKFRFDIDETLGINLKTGVLRMSDLMENDARVLVDLYTNSMAGHIGLAKKGILSQADFMERVRAATDEYAANPGWDQAKAKRDLQLLQDVYSNITGKPMSTQDFSPSSRVAAAMRGYTRSLMLGQLGLTAAFEMSQAVGYMGLRAALQQMPSFRQFLHAVRRGHIPDKQLARDIEHMVGFGREMDMGYARVNEIDDSGVGRVLTNIEAGANKASHAVDVLSGNASMTSMTRQWSGMMAAQEMHDFAVGARKLTDAMKERFVGHGLAEGELKFVLEDLKNYSTAVKGRLETIDYEKWLKESPETYEKFQLALSRKVRDAVQDQDLGETMPFMHTTLGKVVAELKTFMLVSHAKNFLKNLHYRDATTMQVYMVSAVGNALAYMTQTSINYAHDPAKLQEMLTLEKIAAAVVSRTAALGVTSLGIETGYNLATGGESLLGAGSANTGNRTLIPPSLLVAQRLAHAPSILTGMAAPWATTTQAEGREITGLVPNLFGVRNLANAFVNTLPKNEPDTGE